MKFLFNKSSIKIDECKKYTLFSALYNRKYRSKRITCPHCNGKSVIKHGHFSDKKQRYLCKECKKTFNAATNSVISYTKKKLGKWLEYMNCMDKKLSLRKTAKAINISTKTAFYWRHKILKVTSDESIQKFRGIVEVKTTYIRESFKGKRYPDQKINNNSSQINIDSKNNIDEIVCVINCFDRFENEISKTLCRGRINYKKTEELLKNVIDTDCEVCTDNNMAYTSYSKIYNIKLHKMEYTSQILDGKYHIKNAAMIGSELQKLISKCRGVCTRYLNFYGAWIKWIRRNKYKSKIASIKLIIDSKIKFRNIDLNMVPELG